MGYYYCHSSFRWINIFNWRFEHHIKESRFEGVIRSSVIQQRNSLADFGMSGLTETLSIEWTHWEGLFIDSSRGLFSSDHTRSAEEYIIDFMLFCRSFPLIEFLILSNHHHHHHHHHHHCHQSHHYHRCCHHQLVIIIIIIIFAIIVMIIIMWRDGVRRMFKVKSQ